MHFFKSVSLLGSLATSALAIRTVSTIPVDNINGTTINGTYTDASAIAGKTLRILPLGGSITWGQYSTDGNGYRKTLRDLLQPAAKVEYIGSMSSGNMTNPLNEGHVGALIDAVSSYSNLSLPSSPNLILVFTGTNDMYFNTSPASAPARMGALIDHLLAASPDPSVAIVVGTLITCVKPEVAERIETFNTGLREVVAERKERGARVQLAEFEGVLELGEGEGKADFYTDGEHPSDRGYAKMAQVWHEAVGEVAGKGWVGKPLPRGGANGTAVRSGRPTVTGGGVYSAAATGTGVTTFRRESKVSTEAPTRTGEGWWGQSTGFPRFRIGVPVGPDGRPVEK